MMMMIELTLAKEKFKKRTTKLSSSHSECRQPAHPKVYIPLPMYDIKQDFSDFLRQFKAIQI